MPYQELQEKYRDLRKAMIAYLREDNRYERHRRTPSVRLARVIDNTTAPRFYITFSRAEKIIRAMERREKPALGVKAAERLSVDFYKVYMELVSANNLLPLAERKNRLELINDAINSPAPSYYSNMNIASRLMDEVYNRYFVL